MQPSGGIKFWLITSLLFAFGQDCESANILIFILQCSYSQLNALHPYAVGLTQAGHEVTFVLPTPYKQPDSRIKYFIPEKVNRKWAEFSQVGTFMYETREAGMKAGNVNAEGWASLPPSGAEFCKEFFESSETAEWIERSKSKFDLLVIDGLWNDCGLGLAHKFQVPFMYFETTTVLQHWYDTFGVIPENSWLPDLRKIDWGFDLNFWQRLENLFLTLDVKYGFKKYNNYWSTLEELFIKHSITKENLDLEEFQKKASLVLVNTHFSTEVARSLPPIFVPIGGLQCGKDEVKKELPDDVRKFIERQSGFFYVSFGSFAQLPQRKQLVFLEAFKSLPQTGFIMKWCGERPKDVPANVLLLDFAPQQGLLAHEKILGMATHGGMLSTQEVVSYGIPVIGIPVFAEQDYNMENLKRRGAALKLEIVTLTPKELQDAFVEFMRNSSYKKAMIRIHKLSLDRPQHPLDTAVWWTEYVLRHAREEGGLDHLKPLGIHQYWFQRRLGDVWAFLTAVTILLFYIAMKILLFSCKLLFSTRQSAKSPNAKKMKLR